MSRPSRSLRKTLAALAILAGSSGAAAAGPRLDVSGEVLATEPKLSVRVLVTNRGDQPAPAIEVTGEWQGGRSTARIPGGIAVGASDAVVLDFEPGHAGPGVHVLPLLLEHVLGGPSDAGGNPPLASERAWLLVAFGVSPPPAVKLTPSTLRLEVRGRLQVAMESADRRPHRVRLRGLTARGVRIDDADQEVDVPASGTARAALQFARAGAARGTRHGVLLVAETLDQGATRTSVAIATIEIAPDRALLPRARKPLLVLALALLATAVGAEVWRAFRPNRRT